MKQKLSKNQQILGWVFLWNTLICLYSILFLNPVSSSNDDFWLSAIAGNGFGSHSEFLIYVSTLLGYILKFFYHFIPSINWYALFLYVFLLISVVTIEYIATIKFNLSVILLSLFFSIGFSHYFYVVFQYTKVASLLTLTGFLIIFYWIDTKADAPKILLKKYIFAFLFLFTGSLVRLQPFFMICLFGFGLWIVKLIFSIQEKKWLKFLKYYIIPFLLIFSIILGYSYFEENIWDVSTEEKTYFKEYNEIRTKLVDYEIPSYEEHTEEYQSLNLSANDVENLKRWCFADDEKFSFQVLQQVAAMNPDNYFTLKTFLKYIRDNIITHTIFKIFMLLTFICILFAKRKKFSNLLFPHGIFFFVLLYLNYIGRITEWVLNSLWIVYLILVMFAFCECFSHIFLSQKAARKSLLFCLCGSIIFNSDLLIARPLTEQLIHGNLYHCMNGISNTKNITYFCDMTSVYTLSKEYKILEQTPENFFSNIFFCGAWFSHSPQENLTKEKAGIDNLYKDLLTKEDYVVLDSESIDQKLVYFIENYSVSAKYSKIQDYYGYPIYQFSDTFSGVRTENAQKAFLHLENNGSVFPTLLGTLECSSSELNGKTIYLEMVDSSGLILGTYAGRFEQQNEYGIYSLRYQNNLNETNTFTFQLPENTVLSPEYTYHILLRDGDTAQVYTAIWN